MQRTEQSPVVRLPPLAPRQVLLTGRQITGGSPSCNAEARSGLKPTGVRWQDCFPEHWGFEELESCPGNFLVCRIWKPGYLSSNTSIWRTAWCFPKWGTNQSFWDDKLAVGFRDAGFLASLSLRAWSLSLALGPSNTVQGFPSRPHHLLKWAPSATLCFSFPMNGTHLD